MPLPWQDNIMTARLVIKEMPAAWIVRHFYGLSLSTALLAAVCIRISPFFKNGRNIFFDKTDPYYLSKIDRYYTAGLLSHAPELCSVVSQWELIQATRPGLRSTCLCLLGAAQSVGYDSHPHVSTRYGKRYQNRVPCTDSACNPYLAFSVI